MKGFLITSRGSGAIERTPQTIATAVLMTKKKPNKERVKQAIDTIKILMRDERDPVYRERLAEAGLTLNIILIGH